MGAGVRGLREGGGEDGPGGGGRAGDVVEVEGVERRFEGVRDLVAAWLVFAQFQHQLAQDLEVERQVEDVLVEDREVGAPEGVERLVARRARVAKRGRVGEAVGEDVRVGGGLDEVLDLFAALGGAGHGHVLVLRVDGLEGAAVGEVDEGLRLVAGPFVDEAEVEDGFDAVARPLGGDGAVRREPRGAPGRPPRGADAERLVRGRFRLGEGDGLAGRLPCLEGERDPGTVDGGLDALVVDAGDALLDAAEFVVHTCSSTRGSGGSRRGRDA